MAMLKGSYDSDMSDAEDPPRAAQGAPPVPAPVDAVPDSAPIAAPASALADAGPPVAPPARARPARPRIKSAGRNVNLFQKYGNRQR